MADQIQPTEGSHGSLRTRLREHLRIIHIPKLERGEIELNRRTLFTGNKIR